MLTHNYLGNSFKSRLLSCAAACVVAGSVVLPMSVAMADDDTATLTPIKHVIIIIGENRTFDHVFATYTPVHKNDTVLNLLSQKIVNADGTPSPICPRQTLKRVLRRAQKLGVLPMAGM